MVAVSQSLNFQASNWNLKGFWRYDKTEYIQSGSMECCWESQRNWKQKPSSARISLRSRDFIFEVIQTHSNFFRSLTEAGSTRKSYEKSGNLFTDPQIHANQFCWKLRKCGFRRETRAIEMFTRVSRRVRILFPKCFKYCQTSTLHCERLIRQENLNQNRRITSLGRLTNTFFCTLRKCG